MPALCRAAAGTVRIPGAAGILRYAPGRIQILLPLHGICLTGDSQNLYGVPGFFVVYHSAQDERRPLTEE